MDKFVKPISRARVSSLLSELQGSDDHKLQLLAEQLSIYQSELEAQQQELIDSQELVRHQLQQRALLLDRLPVPYFILDRDLKIVDWNNAAHVKANLASRQQKVPLFFTALFTEADSQTLRDWLYDPHNWAEPFEISLANDANSIFRLEAEPFEDGQILAHLSDVTDLKQTKSSLKKSVEELNHALKFMTLATAAGDLGLWRYNPTEEDIEWNKRYYELLGASPEALSTGPQAHINHWLGVLHCEDKERVLEEI
ncbi:MAG: hypothetical protein HWE12_08475, partial [Oceanospirillaceae bacterium]|nr:hypothetical protein [Oceanospirillaceae bacterium]